MIYYCKKAITCLIFCFFIFPLVSFSQVKTLTCGDIKNGVFIFYSSTDASKSVYTRNGSVQKEVNSQTHENILWDVEWLSDCSYSLKYNSGYEDKSKKEIDILNKHKVVIEILSVTENYYVFKSSVDKASNPTVVADTLWIKQRRDVKNKTVNNSGIDSITAFKKAAFDSAISKSAIVYVYRPGKFLNNAMNYDLYMNDVKLCEMGNKSSYIVRIFKEGQVTFHAKIVRQEASITTDIKYGKKYFLRCEITWGFASKPILTMSDEEEAKPYFDHIK